MLQVIICSAQTFSRIFFINTCLLFLVGQTLSLLSMNELFQVHWQAYLCLVYFDLYLLAFVVGILPALPHRCLHPKIMFGRKVAKGKKAKVPRKLFTTLLIENHWTLITLYERYTFLSALTTAAPSVHILLKCFQPFFNASSVRCDCVLVSFTQS